MGTAPRREPSRCVAIRDSARLRRAVPTGGRRSLTGGAIWHGGVPVRPALSQQRAGSRCPPSDTPSGRSGSALHVEPSSSSTGCGSLGCASGREYEKYGLTAGGETHAAQSPGGGSSLTRLVSRAPTGRTGRTGRTGPPRSRRSPGFHHRLLGSERTGRSPERRYRALKELPGRSDAFWPIRP